MSSAEQENKAERQIKAAPEQSAMGAQDAQAARNAGVSDLKAAEAIRTNQSDGSLRQFAAVEDQNMSIELVDYASDGRYNVLASRVSAQEKVEQKQSDKPNVEDQSLTSTGAILAKEAEKNSALEPVKALYDWTKKQEPGAQTQAFKQLAREQLVQVEPNAKAALDALDRRRQAADEQEDCGVHELPKSAEKSIKGHVSYPEKEIEGVKRLTPEDFSKLAKAFEKAGPAAQESIKETSDEILRRTAESYKDTVLFGVNAVVGLLEYDRDLMLNPSKARETAAGAGEVFGLLMYNGAVMSIKTGAYAQAVRQSGDYSLPLKHLPQVLNKWYESLNPADQMAIIATVTGGLHLSQSVKEVQKLRQAGAFSTFLQEAVDLLPRNPEAERRAMEVLSGLVKRAEPIRAPHLEPSNILREPERPITHVEMSKSKDLHGGGNSDKAKDIKSSEQKKPHEVTSESLENPEGLAQLAKKFGISMPPKDTYVFAGEKDAISADAAAKRLGIGKEQLEKLDEAALSGKKLERVPDYRDVFFNAHPGLIPVADRITVHHAIPKWVLKRCSGLFSAKEINEEQYLRGIYKLTNDELHNDKIHNAWERFYRGNRNPSKQDILQQLQKLDDAYGHLFIPTQGI